MACGSSWLRTSHKANCSRSFCCQHEILAPEFAQELREEGHIYMRRYRPTYVIKGYPIDYYPAKTRQAAAIQVRTARLRHVCPRERAS